LSFQPAVGACCFEVDLWSSLRLNAEYALKLRSSGRCFVFARTLGWVALAFWTFHTAGKELYCFFIGFSIELKLLRIREVIAGVWTTRTGVAELKGI